MYLLLGFLFRPTTIAVLRLLTLVVAVIGQLTATIDLVFDTE